MKTPRRYKNIYGDIELLKRVSLLYSDCNPEFHSDEYHYETIGYTNAGYAIPRRIEDGPITHLSLLISAKDFESLKKSLKISKDTSHYKAYKLA